MNNRQKRLCRALLDFYDASGAQPCPIAQLARKTGYDASDIYDKDSESGDLWPFDPKARGSLTGMLSFTSGKNPTISITSAGLVALENLCKDDSAAASEKAGTAPRAKTGGPAQVAPAPVKPAPAPAKAGPATAKPFPSVTTKPVATAKPFPGRTKPPVPVPAKFTSDDVSEARARFRSWLKSDPAAKALLGGFDGADLIDAAFDKFFVEFLQGKDS